MAYNALQLQEVNHPTNVELLKPTKQRVRSASLEILEPAHDSEGRKSSIITAIFNLVATVCGGGVLSLPYAFSIAGIVHSTILMIFAAVITDFALYILCSCARRTGGKSYADVTRFAFGPLAEIATTFLLFSLLICIITAYMILLQDIWTPIVLLMLEYLGYYNYTNDGDDITDDTNSSAMVDNKNIKLMVLISLLLLSFPLMLQKDLHALRNTCYVGFISILVLCIALVYCAWEQTTQINQEEHVVHREIKLYASTLDDLLFVFPIIVLSFFSSYNALSVHSALINPTRKRLKCVLDASVILCFILFFVVAVSGYVYTCNNTTKDNIFLNFSASNSIMMLGRAGYAFTILFGLPLVVLPCRDAILSIPQQIIALRNNSSTPSPILPLSPGDTLHEMSPLLYAYKMNRIKQISSAKKTRIDTRVTTTTSGTSTGIVSEFTVRLWITIAIVCISFTFAVAVPGVSIVWRICGSSLAITIAFTIPSACYLKIRRKKGMTIISIGAWLLLIFSLVSSILCTSQTILDIW